MWRAEFHCHSLHSKDSLLRVETLLAACRRKGLDRVAITDHNTLAGALRARELDPERVIVGEEINVRHGELLAYFVREEVPPGLAPGEAIARLREQGAFVAVAHPFDRTRKSEWEPAELEELAPLVDAVEIFNARCLWPGFNELARRFAEQHGRIGIAGSDAHTAAELGRATAQLPPFHDAESLEAALRQARFQARLSSPLAHLASRYAVWYKRLAAPRP